MLATQLQHSVLREAALINTVAAMELQLLDLTAELDRTHAILTDKQRMRLLGER